MESDLDEWLNSLVSKPREYICTLDEHGMKCNPFEPVYVRKTTDARLLKYCNTYKRAKILVRYPRGQKYDAEFMNKFREHAQILFFEDFQVTKSQLRHLLSRLYYNSSHMKEEAALWDKCDKTWGEDEDNRHETRHDSKRDSKRDKHETRKITIFVFELYEKCGCSDFTHSDSDDDVPMYKRNKNLKAKYGPKEESRHLKRTKKHIRQIFGTMHAIHTSDNQEETMHFANHIFTDTFLQ